MQEVRRIKRTGVHLDPQDRRRLRVGRASPLCAHPLVPSPTDIPQCTNTSGHQVAAYDSENKDTRNPQNRRAGGTSKQLYIDEQHQQLAGGESSSLGFVITSHADSRPAELLTSLIIMRHIRKHGL